MFGALESGLQPMLFEAALSLANRDLGSVSESVRQDVATQLSRIAMATWPDVPMQGGAPSMQQIVMRMQGMKQYTNLVKKARDTGAIYSADSDPRIHAPWALDTNALVNSINARTNPPAQAGISPIMIGAVAVAALLLFSGKKK